MMRVIGRYDDGRGVGRHDEGMMGRYHEGMMMRVIGRYSMMVVVHTDTETETDTEIHVDGGAGIHHDLSRIYICTCIMICLIYTSVRTS